MKKLVTIMLLLSSATATFSPSLGYCQGPIPQASPSLVPKDVQDLKDLLVACDSTLQACDKANKDKQAQISKQSDIINAQMKDIQSLQNEQHSIMNNKLLWFGLGALFTGLTYKLTH